MIKNAIEVLRKEGLAAFLRKAALRIIEITRSLYYAVLMRFIRRNLSPEEATRFAFKDFGGFIRPLQDEREIAELARLVDARKPKVVLEIGTAAGGTLFILTRAASADALLISIDLPKGLFGGGYPRWREPLYRSFALGSQKLYLIRDDSHRTDTLKKVEDILNDRKVDLLFIDGDHTYEGVKKDFDSYISLVNRPGMVAFHDIVVHPPETGCDVHSFWEEVKAGRSYREIIADSKQRSFGIGVLYVD
ncbi:MAG: class I SAM-dependent methyltransferase [Candidatus Omnitrophica bacterium]|nr:class I SAM-dependent methyltransferase [Candidatus Omnitrophota bacterium]